MPILIGAGALSLTACATGPAYGDGGGLYLQSAYGSPYDSFSCGIDGWNTGIYNSYGFPGCGWYNGFFYPGSGSYMYDRNHGRHAWTGGGGHSGAGIAPTSQPTFRAPGSNGGARIGGGTRSFGGSRSFGGGNFGGGRGFSGGGGGGHGGGRHG
jgi:hypothetical protein